jgi:nucleoside-diphosphate-sugar epimerase
MILVTGSTGLVGSQLLFDLASAGSKVRAFKRSHSDLNSVNRLFQSFPKAFSNIEWFDGDIEDLYSIDEAMNGIDTVYHAAAFISFQGSEREKMMRINARATGDLVNAALRHNVKNFCFISSVAALGRVSGEQHIDETSWWKTSSKNSNYAISKNSAEREVWRGIEEGLPAVIVNPSIILGSGNWKSGSTVMFPQVWKGLSFYSNGITGFVDVRDVSKAARLLVEKGITNERYILNSENVPYRKVFDLIAESFKKPKAKIRVTPTLGEIGWRLEALRSLITGNKPFITKETARNAQMQWFYSNEKIKREIGIEFITVEQSVKDTCEKFLQEFDKNY